MTCEDMYDFLNTFIDTAFIDGAVCVGGFNQETFERILFYKTGYRSFEDFMDIPDEEME